MKSVQFGAGADVEGRFAGAEGREDAELADAEGELPGLLLRRGSGCAPTSRRPSAAAPGPLPSGRVGRCCHALDSLSTAIVFENGKHAQADRAVARAVAAAGAERARRTSRDRSGTCGRCAAAAAATCTSRGLWPEACSVNMANWQASQFRTRAPPGGRCLRRRCRSNGRSGRCRRRRRSRGSAASSPATAGFSKPPARNSPDGLQIESAVRRPRRLGRLRPKSASGRRTASCPSRSGSGLRSRRRRDRTAWRPSRACSSGPQADGRAEAMVRRARGRPASRRSSARGGGCRTRPV